MNSNIKESIDYKLMHCSNRLKHFFHVISNIRPIIWIGVYLCAMPIFALIYYWMPDTQFRIPDGGSTDYGSWLYYSVVTITTLGFGDYTPAHGWAQAVTAIEVAFGLSIFGFFLNAVGAMRSEIDVTSAVERQRLVHQSEEKDKLIKNIPVLLHRINNFLAYCYAVTTPEEKRDTLPNEFNPSFTIRDMRDMYLPSGLPFDNSTKPAVEQLLSCARDTALFLDSLQSRIDMTLWPKLMNDCFSFVASSQLFHAQDSMLIHPDRMMCNDQSLKVCDARKLISEGIATWRGPAQVTDDNPLNPVVELYIYIKANADMAHDISTLVTEIASKN